MSPLFQFAAGLMQAQAAIIRHEAADAQFAARDAFEADMAAQARLLAVDITLTEDDLLEDAIYRDMKRHNTIRDFERGCVKAKELQDLDYQVVIDVTAVPDCEESCTVEWIEWRVGGAKERLSIVAECKGKEVVGGRILWTFVARVAV